MAEASKQKWQISGEYMESCNCDYLCPCIFTNPQAGATFDQCTSLQIYRIDKGSFDGVKLDGLAFAMIIRSKKVMSEGDWIFAGVVDAAADDAQRKALTQIVSGEVGGPPARVRSLLTSDFRGVEVRPIAFNRDGLQRSTAIPGVLEFEIEGVAGSRWHAPGRRTSTRSAWISTWRARATTDTTRRSAGRRRPERGAEPCQRAARYGKEGEDP
jgi:hypothetical protein